MGLKIIAEAGVNHNGNIQIAKDLVAMAADCGADYIKFQTFSADSLATNSAGLAEYQRQNLKKNVSQKVMLESLELSIDHHYILMEECSKFNIGFLSSPFDLSSLKFLCSLNLDYIKIPSGELVNRPLLNFLAHANQNILLSTGMCDLSEVVSAVEYLERYGQDLKKVTLLQCTSQYPAPFEELNINVIREFDRIFKCDVGFSDHSLGAQAAIAAVALGAVVVEKHITMDRRMSGPDHIASLNPKDFNDFVKALRNVSLALGDGVKRLMKSEVNTLIFARKSIVASKFIKAGEIFSEDNLITKRPGTGLSSIFWDDIIGRISTQNYEEDNFINTSELSVDA